MIVNLAVALEEIKEFHLLPKTYLGQEEFIPVGTWRQFVFFVNADYVDANKLSDKAVADGVMALAARAGVCPYQAFRLAQATTGVDGNRYYSVMMMGENRWNGLTLAELQRRTKLLAIASREVVSAELEDWFDRGNMEIVVFLPSTLDSLLPANTWYAALVGWPDVALSEKQAAAALAGIGMSLMPDLYKVGTIKGGVTRAMLIYTGNSSRRVGDIAAALGSPYMAVNLAQGQEDQWLDLAAKGKGLSNDLVEAAGDLGAGVGGMTEALLSFLGSLSTGVKYALYAAVPALALYLGWRGYHWWKAEKASVEQGRGGSEKRLKRRRKR